MTAYVQHRPLVRLVEGARTVAGDVVGGGMVIAHSGLALLGVTVAVATALIASQPDFRHQAQTYLAGWLGERQEAPDAPATPARAVAAATAPGAAPAIKTAAAAIVTAPVLTEPSLAVTRVTAVDPRALPREQARLTQWIARKYQVAPEPVAALVSGAYKAGQSSRIDPSLILAVMAVESSFNPFAQSTAGAQGLMQVMTRVHGEKYDGYGGNYAAFDPLSNLRVGVWVLRDCIDKTGSTAGGLRCYVGATHLKTDGGYVNKVMAEYTRLRQVVSPSGDTGAYPVANDTATAPATPAPPAVEQTPQTTQTDPAPHTEMARMTGRPGVIPAAAVVAALAQR